jgi:uncharacterized protein YeaO (DUF488 family)
MTIRTKRAYEAPDPDDGAREDDAVDELLELHREEGVLTLVYGARDTEHNNAVALRDYLRRRGEAE